MPVRANIEGVPLQYAFAILFAIEHISVTADRLATGTLEGVKAMNAFAIDVGTD